MPGMFRNKTPQGVFVRQIAGAASEYEAAVIVLQLKNGRDIAKTKATARTLNKTRKVEGRKNFLELHPQFISLLRQILAGPFSNRKKKTGGTMPLKALSTWLHKKGVCTQPRTHAKTTKRDKGGKPISPGRLKQWLETCDKM